MFPGQQAHADSLDRGKQAIRIGLPATDVSAKKGVKEVKDIDMLKPKGCLVLIAMWAILPGPRAWKERIQQNA